MGIKPRLSVEKGSLIAKNITKPSERRLTLKECETNTVVANNT